MYPPSAPAMLYLPSPPPAAAGLSLGSEFQRCAFQAQQRNERMEERSLGLIKMPDGRTMHFSKEARRVIHDTVIHEIR